MAARVYGKLNTIMPFIDHIAACNVYEPGNFLPFFIDDTKLGEIRRDAVERLSAFPEIFVVAENRIELALTLTKFGERSAAMAQVVAKLTAEKAIPEGEPEAYPVVTAFGEPPYLEIDRTAVQFFGFPAFGVHVNGFCRPQPDEINMWIGRRAPNLRVCPGMLDNMVAGGQPIGLSLMQNLIKEADEEAGIPESLARRAEAVGHISYRLETENGMRPDRMYCYDLELPPDFVPVSQDGSVEEFYLWPLERVAEVVAESFEFKFNCNLAIIDFLIRHNFIGERHPEFEALIAGLRK